VEIEKKRIPQIEVTMAGYQSQPCMTHASPGAGYLVADAVLCAALFPVGCISFIDADGARNELDSRACHVNLQPAAPAYGAVSWGPTSPPAAARAEGL
jgi:hypothetical protein